MYRKTFNKHVRFNESITKRQFKNKEEVFDFLTKEVFEKEEFVQDVTHTALEMDLSYNVVFIMISTYLTDLLYEIDKAHTQRKRKKFGIFCYINFYVSTKESLIGRGVIHFFRIRKYLKEINYKQQLYIYKNKKK